MSDDFPIFLTTPQAAKLLGVCHRRVYEWAARSHDPLPAIKLSGIKSKRFHRDQVIAWASRQAGIYRDLMTS